MVAPSKRQFSNDLSRGVEGAMGAAVFGRFFEPDELSADTSTGSGDAPLTAYQLAFFFCSDQR
jgi:hypothetical protein